MPYADPEKKKEAMRDRYRLRYLTEKGFAEKEKKRQRRIYEKNRDKIIARVLARRAKLKKKAK